VKYVLCGEVASFLVVILYNIKLIMSSVQGILRHNEGLSSDDEMPGQDMAGLSKVLASVADPECLSRIRIFSIPLSITVTAADTAGRPYSHC
jgi:hypothetical protein